MTFWSMLTVKVHEGSAESAAQAHTKRRAVEEAAETVAGFRHGETLLSKDDPQLMCVLCVWNDEASYEEGQDSPVRAKQVSGLTGVISAEVKTMTFPSAHAVEKTKSKGGRK